MAKGLLARLVAMAERNRWLARVNLVVIAVAVWEAAVAARTAWKEAVSSERARTRALPVWGAAPIPAERDRDPASDEQSLGGVVRIFLRTWPFIAPLVFGYWRAAGDWRSPFAKPLATRWEALYAPYLATAAAAFVVLAGWLPMGLGWQHDLLLWAVVAMVALSWALIVLAGRSFAGAAVALVLIGVVANLFAALVVAGWRDNVGVGLVSVGCLALWLCQYRIAEGRLHMRVRLGCHVIYYYILVGVNTLLGMVGGLFIVDLLNQSVLQAEPLTDFLANFVGRSELGGDGALTAAERQELQWVYIGFVVAIGFVTFPIGVALPYYNMWIMQAINQDLRLALVERWHQLSLRYHGDHRVGDSVYRIYQDSAQVTAIVGMLISVATQVMQYAMAIVFVSALHPVLGVMGVTIAVLAVLWARWFSPRLRVRSLVAREANSDLTSRVQESLGAIRVVKANGAEAREQRRFEEDSVVAFNAAHRVRSLVALAGIVMFTAAAAILLSAEFFIAIWAGAERETFAMALIGLIGLSFVRWNLAAFRWTQEQLFQASNQVRGVIREWTAAQDMAMGLGRVFDILDIEPDVRNAPDAVPMPPFEREVRFESVRFGYVAQRPVLRDVSFAAGAGTVTAVVGPTGSGKSTLMGLLTRLFDPDAGRVTIDGADLRRLDVESLRANVAIALQQNVLFAMSVRDNIRYVVPEASDEAVERAAAVACFDEVAATLPDGMDTVLGDRGGRLSTGQRQRLTIARAIAKDAPILILDEPTAALDADTEHRVLERLAAWGAGRAVFLITHRVSTIRQADQILYLEEGRIVEQGSHDELMANAHGRYRRFVELDAQALTPTAGAAGQGAAG